MYKIVYLYSEVMPYQTIVYKEMSEMGHEVHVFMDDKNRQTPYVPDDVNNVYYYKQSHFSKGELYDKVLHLDPDLLVVCGWSSKKYLYTARKIRKQKRIPVVSPIDTQFTWRFKQILGFIISPFYIKKAFTHIWVPGVRQYFFARCLGYGDDRIILNSLTGNTHLFYKADIDKKKNNYPKNLLFVGRYNEVKGLQLLMEVWSSIEDKKGWKIVCAGNGPLQEMLMQHKDVEVLGFQSQENLVTLAEKSGAFILPSIYEPWALVIQEFAAAGLPIICSIACGASPHLVINKYNGYTFSTNNFDDLRRVLLHVINMKPEELLIMATNSRNLSRIVTPTISASSLLSILE